VVGGQGEVVVEALAWGDAHERVVGVAGRRHVQPVEMEVGGHRQVVDQGDGDVLARLEMQRGRHEAAVVGLAPHLAAADVEAGGRRVEGDGQMR